MDDNIHNLRDALEWLDRRIREEAEYDGEMTNEHAIQLGFITNMLEKFPLRHCDVGSPAEQERRYKATGEVYHTLTLTNALAWAQTPYEAEEGAGE